MVKHFFLLAGCGFLLLTLPARGQDEGKKGKLQELIAKLQKGNDADKWSAAVALAELGPDAAAAVPELITALQAKNEDLRLNAAIALGKIGAPAVGPVAKVLASTNASDRYYAIWALGWIGPPAKNTTPQVIQALSDKDEGVRRKAAYTLGRIAPDATTAVAPLIKTLADVNSEVRQSAAEALAKFGAEAVPSLIDALKDDSLAIRTEAVRALGNIGSEAREAVPHLRTLFLNSDAMMSQQAAEALSKIGKASIPVLSEALKHSSANIRGAAVTALGKIGADAVPVLVDALAEKYVDVRQKAAVALTPLRISDKMVVLALAHAVQQDPDQSVRQQCLFALQQLGTGAKLAAPKLIAALKDSDGQNRLWILGILQNLGEGEQTLAVAAELLKDANVQVRQSAVNLLATQGKAALPHLIVALQDADQNVRFTAVSAIQRVPGDIKDALLALLPLLTEGNSVQRRNVVQALGPVGQAAVPHLITCLKDKDNFVRAAAVDALRIVGGDAKKAIPTLADMALQDPYTFARRNAILAIAAIEPEKLNDVFANVQKHNDEKVRLLAYQALYTRFGKKAVVSTIPAKLALPHLIEATKDAAANIRLVGLQGVSVYAADAKDAIPAVTALLNDPDMRVRNQAQVVLSQIKGK